MSRQDVGGIGLLFVAVLLIVGCSGGSGQPAAGGRVQDPGVHLAPDPANAGTQLAVTLDVVGVDPGQCHFAWSRNGNIIPGATEPLLSPDRFAKGDRIRVEVEVPARTARPAQKLAAEASISDSPPVVESARLTLNATTTGTLLSVRAEGRDIDGDALSYSFSWFRNGNRIEGAVDSTLSIGSFDRADRVTVEVVGHAAGLGSAPRQSEEFRLENRAPQFSSQPVALAAGEPAFRYQATATDPDGDPVSYELIQAPNGMTITPNGAIEWALPAPGKAPAAYAIRIRASDAKGGEASQDFTLRLAAQGSKPTH